MSYQTSAAAPDRLAAFAAGQPAVDEPLARATWRVAADLADCAAAAGGFGAVGDDILVPLVDLRAEAAHQAAWVGAVGEAFRAAGADSDGDGVVTVRDADLPPVGSASRADRLAEVTALLASLRERAAAGDPGITAAELATLLATAHDLVTTAADPQAEAERILAAVGAGDIAVAVDVLGGATAQVADPEDPAVAALSDLGHLVSLGLERQPARAERWARQLTSTLAARALVGGSLYVDGLALLAGGNAPGTAAFGVALVAALRESGVGTHRTGPVRWLFGGTDPLAPAVAAAGARGADGSFSQVPLAHGVVADLARADRGLPLAATFGNDAPAAYNGAWADRGLPLAAAFGNDAPAGYDGARADALRASVDPSVSAADRVHLALDLATLYRDQDQILPAFPDLRYYGPEVTSAFGAATQPLLEHWAWHGDGGTVDVPAASGAAIPVPDGGLWTTVGELAQAPGGADGLGMALGGATTARLSAGAAALPAEMRAAGLPSPAAPAAPGIPLAPAAPAAPGIPLAPAGPVAPNSLRELGRLYARTATAAGNARFEAIADHVEQGPTIEEAVRPIIDGALGEFPGGSTVDGAVHSLELATADPPEVTGGGPVTRGLEPTLTAALVRLDLAHRPDLATEAVARALHEAEEAGPTGVYDLIHGDDRVAATGGGRALSELQALVTAQEDVVDVRLATTADQALSIDGD